MDEACGAQLIDLLVPLASAAAAGFAPLDRGDGRSVNSLPLWLPCLASLCLYPPWELFFVYIKLKRIL